MDACREDFCHGSPFSPILETAAEALPPAIREQYLLPGDATYQVVLAGTMRQVWHRPTWLRPFFWLLACADILFPETGTDIPAKMVIAGEPGPDGLGRQTWRRTFAFPTPRHFNATMAYDFQLQRVVEWLGPAELIQIVWNVQFQPPGTIHIATEHFELRLGRWRVRLPRWLSGEVRAVERADSLRDDAIEIDLTVAHPFLGSVFGYDGVFLLERQYRQDEVTRAD